MKKAIVFLSVALCLILLSTTAFAFGPKVKKSRGQTVFVAAAYSDLSYKKDDVTINQVCVTRLIIRNTDLDLPITVNSVAFYDPDGNWVKEFLESPVLPVLINPLASITFLASGSTLGVDPYDIDGGRPCFLVEWEANRPTNVPSISGIVLILRPDGNWVEFLAGMSGTGIVIEEKRKFKK